MIDIEYLREWFDLRVRHRFQTTWSPQPATVPVRPAFSIGCLATLALQAAVIAAGYAVARDSNYARQVWTALWLAGLIVGVVIGLLSGWISSRREVPQ